MSRADSGKKIKLLGGLPQVSPHCLRGRAVQRTVGREVEFRILPEQPPPPVLEAFGRELEDLALLDHAAFLPLLDRGQTRGRHYYLVPAREDPTLADLIADPAFPLRDRARCVRSLAGALAALHLRQRPLGHLDPRLLCWNNDQGQVWFLHTRHLELARQEAHLVPDDARPAVPPSLQGDVFHWGHLAYRLVTSGQDPFPEGVGEVRPLAEVQDGLAPELADSIENALGWTPRTRLNNACELHAYLKVFPADLKSDLGDMTSRLLDQIGRAADDPSGGAAPRPPSTPETTGADQPDASTTHDAPGDLGVVAASDPAPSIDGDLLQAASGDDQLLSSTADVRAQRAGARIHATMEYLRQTGQVQLPRTQGLATAAEVEDEDRLDTSQALATFLAAMLLGLGVRSWTSPAAPVPPPSPVVSAQVWLSPEAQAEYLAEAQLVDLLGYRVTAPEAFRDRWKQLRTLVLGRKVPPPFDDPDRVLALLRVHERDPAEGAAALDRFRAELREVLGGP